MIVAHAGAAFAARRLVSVPIGWLLGASFAPDLWRLALNDAHYGAWRASMYSHALPWSAVIAVVLASMAWIVLQDGAAALVVGLLVASHVGLDLVSGWKPLWLGGPRGMDLLHVEQVEFVVEAFVLWIGWRLLPAAAKPRWVASRALLVTLLLIQGAYVVMYYRGRPADTRCILYPFAPCWTRL